MADAKRKPVLTERDRAVLRSLVESRVMTLGQIGALHFTGYEYAKKRMQQLKAAAYIAERRPRSNPGRYYPSILSLARQGFEAFIDGSSQEDAPITWDCMRERLDVSGNTLQHELEVVDMKVAFVNALRARCDLDLREFSTNPNRYQFNTEHLESGQVVILRADGFARVCDRSGTEHAFFFEWDRSTEAHRKLGVKAFGYQRYIESGAFALWSGGVADPVRYPVRVVFVLPNEERRNNVAEHFARLRHPRTAQRIATDGLLLTTHEEFLRDPLGEIYLDPAGYRDALRGSPFDPERYKSSGRVCGRDRLVAANVAMKSLIEGDPPCGK